MGNVDYSHDVRGQITRAAYTGGFAENYGYDEAQNIQSSGAQPEDRLFGERPLDGLTIDQRLPRDTPRTGWLQSPGGVVEMARGPLGEKVTLTHDVCGRVVTRSVERKGFRPQKWIYEWDAMGRMSAARTPDGEWWRYGVNQQAIGTPNTHRKRGLTHFW